MMKNRHVTVFLNENLLTKLKYDIDYFPSIIYNMNTITFSF